MLTTVLKLIIKMKKIFKIIFILLIMPISSLAATLLQPLSGSEGLPSGELSNFLSWLFIFALSLAAFLAVVQIVIAGVQIIVSGANETVRSSAKNKISNAIWGLLLALSVWLILNFINPDLAKMKFELDPITLEQQK
jgi:hypothetical protein